jgi:hypothetical protein
MHKTAVRQITLAGLFIAIGLVLPMAFHVLGPGTTFLPMHIPVLIAGFSLGLPMAILVGTLTPLLSSLLTGMPLIFPVLPFMVFELGTYAMGASLFYRTFKWNVYVSLLLTMILGRITAMAAVWVLVNYTTAKLPNPLVFITGAVTAGGLGILIQLLLIPPIVILLRKRNLI